MIVTETHVFLLRASRSTLSHYTAQQLLRAIHRDAHRLISIAEKDCNIGLTPRDATLRSSAESRVRKHLAELCGRRVKVTFEGDPRGCVTRFWNYNDNTETQTPRFGY